MFVNRKIVKKDSSNSLAGLFDDEMETTKEPEAVEDFEEMLDDEDSILEHTDEEIENDEDLDYSEEEEELFEEEQDEDDEDLFRVNMPKRKAKLDEDDYESIIGKIKVEKVKDGKYGPWVRVTIPFKINNPETGEIITVHFVANKSMGEKSRLLPVIKGALGRVPDEGFSLKQLEGKKVRASIEHSIDDKGNVWENVVSVRKIPFKKN